MFEIFAGRSFDEKKLADWFLLFYSTLYANNKDFGLEVDAFISLCDEHPDLFNQFNQFITDNVRLEQQKAVDKPEADGVKKKTIRKTKK